MNEWQQRVIALAGMSLSAMAVQKLARSGELYPESITNTLVHSLLQQNPDNIEDIYGGLENIQPGIQAFIRQAGNNKNKDLEVTRYLVGLIHLSRRLLKQPDVLNLLGERIAQVKRQKEEFEFEDYRVQQSFAGIYRELISPLGQPIRINGNPEFLKRDSNQDHIRTLLLAGIRSAVLWQQVGGKRRHFVFSRKKMLDTAQQLLHVA
ncbi:high frequency lysogenization protein HflD [Idiomarina abyssalis]|uniref:high frequency lysogenization protein HflD n=1 Tax=Idiomarina abyssalis TaxID=86102 RepID=UPI001C98124D|nr:high frequency lysogenization protein HflD [Idiomarina abyssalis]QZN89777.1 high frequency lysogenization protein HflD [Idiomarina abyssalis]